MGDATFLRKKVIGVFEFYVYLLSILYIVFIIYAKITFFHPPSYTFFFLVGGGAGRGGREF
jgi:hypothetical protein